MQVSFSNCKLIAGNCKEIALCLRTGPAQEASLGNRVDMSGAKEVH
jgi:hypothetical protein